MQSISNINVGKQCKKDDPKETISEFKYQDNSNKSIKIDGKSILPMYCGK